ncbi:hypothetical protein BC351_32150 [Paenibacillus ferrarius]|uniref:PGAP2IP C-terminal nuclease-like domain-containing protein n=1 Tax=Paenibacillus ferrarius TaxID=1469647 RepID=A0A1V4HFN1_9BACL|nr:endonuclease/exonuclease/phosphatase family protein [Paenibacillus ferrarius]OPH53130.1 hypothetical protein BC351_32150 [Paenibacillus ferrarius]
MGLLRHTRYVSCFTLLFLLLLGLSSSSIKSMPTSTVLPVSLQKASSAGLTIITFNIHHGEGLDGKVNLERIAELLGQEHADVIALQEVDRFRLRSGFVDQAKALAELLGMQMRFAPSLTYPIGQYGNAILSRYPIENSSYELLPGAKETRSLLTAQLQVGSEHIQVATTHLGLSEEDRNVQLARISELLADTEVPLVLTGDFNMELDAFKDKMDNMQLSDIPLSQTMKATFTDGKRIDYVFTNRTYFGSAQAIPTIYSDHSPVITLIPLGSRVRV